MPPTSEPLDTASVGHRPASEDLSPRGWTEGPAAFLVGAAAVVALLFVEAWTRGLVLSQADHLFTTFPWVTWERASWERPGNLLLGDVPWAFYPFLVFARESLAAWQLPLWNPGIFQDTRSSPPTRASCSRRSRGWRSSSRHWYGLVPAAAAKRLFGGLGMFLFVRRLGLARPAALFAGVAFLLNPFVARLARAPAIGCRRLGPVVVVVGGLRDCDTWAARHGTLGGDGRRRSGRGSSRDLLQTPAPGGGVGSAGGVAEFTPTAGHRESRRRRPARRDAGGGAVVAVPQRPGEPIAGPARPRTDPFILPPQDSIAMLVPNFFGNPAHGLVLNAHSLGSKGANYCEMTVYAGLATATLVVVAAVVRWRDGRVRLLVAAGVVSALLAFRDGAPGVHQLASALPLFRLAALSRFGFLVTVSLGVLAAFGLDRILGGDRDRARAGRRRRPHGRRHRGCHHRCRLELVDCRAVHPPSRRHGPIARDWCLLATALAAACVERSSGSARGGGLAGR